MANSWRRERWDSLRLLTPNWQSRLPGHRYDGAGSGRLHDDAGGGRLHLAGRGRCRARESRANTAVTSVARADDGYRVVTSDGEIRCRSVVLASGGYNAPSVPAVSASLPPGVEQITPFDYREPSQLADGGVLVVGASATGVQLADEIHRSGRPVTLAVGEHVRLPRRYRGRDVLWWMDRSGVWNERYDAIDDLTRPAACPRRSSSARRIRRST